MPSPAAVAFLPLRGASRFARGPLDFKALLPASVRCVKRRCRLLPPDALLGFPTWNPAPGTLPSPKDGGAPSHHAATRSVHPRSVTEDTSSGVVSRPSMPTREGRQGWLAASSGPDEGSLEGGGYREVQERAPSSPRARAQPGLRRSPRGARVPPPAAGAGGLPVRRPRLRGRPNGTSSRSLDHPGGLPRRSSRLRAVLLGSTIGAGCPALQTRRPGS